MRRSNEVLRVVAVHDLSGIGRAGLTVVIPVLSTMGIQVCPLPSAVLSAHGLFPGYYSVDFTRHMQPIAEHWLRSNASFDAVYSGYLASVEAVDEVMRLVALHGAKGALVVVDPVLGDSGKLYGVTPPEMVSAMRRLVARADVITPNITELFLLLNLPYRAEFSLDELKQWMVALADLGPEHVVVTSVPCSSLGKGCVVAYSAADGSFARVEYNLLPVSFPGTGDAFTSVLTGALMQGDKFGVALNRAVHFVGRAVRVSVDAHVDPAHGILLERVLSCLNESRINCPSEKLD